MSSWLGGLGSGLGQVGGSLSSFTGQISTFTKDMLLEGVEEVEGVSTELQVSSSKMEQVEAENERLKRIHAELEEKLEASEIQNKQQSAEYRILMQQRDASEAPGAGNGDQGEVLKLQRIIKELREEMGREVEDHQHELAALQDAQRQKMADVIRRHRDELAEYEERIEELEEQKQTGGNSPASVTHDSSSKASSLHSTSLQEAAEERLKELTASLEEAAEERLKELTASLEEAGRRQATLQREKMEAQAENAELLQNNTQLQSSVTALQTRVQEEKAWNKAQLVQEIQGLTNALAGAEREMLRMKTLEREPKSQVERADVLELNAIIGTLRKEKVMTEQEKMNLLERLACAEDRVESDVLDRREFSPAASEQIAELRAELEKREQALKDNREEQDTLVITLEELDRHNTEATQHVISVKEKLSVQLKESETEVSRLQSELSTTTDQRVALQEELQAQQEKLSQSAYILNDLHMGKQQLEATVKELREKLGRATTMGKETQMLQRTVQEREEQLSAARAELCEAGERGRESGGSSEELEDLRRELAEMRSSQEKVMSEDYEMKMEKQRLKTEAEHAQGRIEELARQVREVQAALNRTVLEKDTRIEALKLEKSQLEGELVQAERGLQEQARQYQQTIEELTAARSMDASALQTAHERTVKLNQEKDLKISQLRRDVEQMASEHRDTDEMLSVTVAEEKKQLIDLLQEKDSFTESLRANMAATQRELESVVQAATQEAETLRGALEEKDSFTESLRANMAATQRELEAVVQAATQEAETLRGALEEKDSFTESLRANMAATQRELEAVVQAATQEAETLRGALEEKDSFTESLRANMAATQRELESVVQAATQEAETLRGALEEKDSFTESLRANMAATQRELESVVQAATQEAETLRGALEEKDTQLGCMKEDNSHLKEEMERLTDQLSRPQPPGLAELRAPDIITELENEITQLKTSGDASRRTVEEQQGHLLSSQQSLLAQQNELEQAHQRHEQSRENYDRLIRAKDEEIRRLQQEVDHLGPTQYSQEQEVVILQREDETKSSLNNRENGNEKHDLSKVEVESLVKGIKEKETEINQLNEKNQNLTRRLDQLVVSREEMGKLSQMVQEKDVEIQALHSHVSLGGGGHSQDVLSLQQQLQAYAVEREQVLAVLNEKTRENSQLRGDYQHIMDIVAGKEAVLLKVQQENMRLSTMSDPSGSREMFRETIQNLSRIIREKDIEIDALTQKCQTLVSVLQAGDSGGVSSNQFEELLQERDTLKQQVKKMEEWKMQVITTVKNMQHESGQLVEELHKLQGQVDADKDCTSDLSVDYSRLIHSYERKERKLGSLSHELAHVQQTISQLSSTKDVLLGKLDSVAQSPQVTPLSAALTSSAQPPAAVEPPRHQVAAPATPGNQEGLRQELESLRALLSERETIIRTLQENNHRLSNSAQVSESEQRGQVDEARQVRERLDALQLSVREKDLLIKTKGDQLNQVSENLRNRESDNELLKQAVTNLKERALILEMDTRKLKDENEAVAQRSREKESEFRALQETNMQVSLLMREKEFERSAVSEKAAAMEKMLKDREQGNSQRSGELNQLLNELRSMQEKAVAFQQERDQVMLALKQKQMETTAVQTELQHVKDREQRLKLELDRLRNHLLEIEDTYTREALAAEDREAELRRRVTLLDDRLATSSSQVESTSHQASLQVESLQEQLSGTVRQRDEALTQLRAARDQVNQYAVSLSNLQVVIEQFQQEEKAMYSSELDKYKREKDEWRRKAVNLEDRASALQINLDEANAALDSATRLTDQLDLMEEQLEELKKQVDVRQEMLEEAQDKLMTVLNSTEGKVDQALMRNLFTGYFHTPKPKRSEVLRLMGSVLGLDKDEVNQMLEEEGGRGGWVSSWLGGRTVQSGPNTPQRPGAGQGGFNNSFSEMFVKFLEVESSPVVPAPRLPVYDINPLSAPPPGRTTSSAWAQQSEGGAAAGRGQRAAGESNPFLAPRSTVVPLMHHGSGSSSGSGGHHLLMKPISDSLPTFTPVPVSPESGGQVLKDLLKQ
ncbi:thyroid receptor-interacting protein 11-like isoform X2 [Salvelinus fontinalis]|uniref:thyroid receptor-interacting protein 11-like isoform X2 n=1 Tax=Salvelinus fontinalis TaxID=8038 RepID=UPI00248552B3|nr:thyroid receptor-interacting protein 11-like isoform X2 [Salvelinus fontinalis]